MTENLHGVTQELLRDIEKKDQRFRVTQTIFLVMIAVLLAVLLYVSFQNQQHTISQLQKTAQDRTQQIQGLKKHIDCVVSLAQTTDGVVQLSDIEDCKLNNN